ncbi:MAG: hypothetical protein GY940_42610 [bacterium]|nr:hypothetical protein [bacterium]
MIYRVKANVIEKKAGEFYRKLTDGTILEQRPDGSEIVASMRRAKFTGPGVIEWFETCYCHSPLYHERQTVYDFYLTGITTQLVEEKGDVDGDSFWSYLRNAAKT